MRLCSDLGLELDALQTEDFSWELGGCQGKSLGSTSSWDLQNGQVNI